MDNTKIILSIINERISKLNDNDNLGIRYYEDYKSIEQGYLDGYNNGGLAELEYIKRQIEFLLK